MGLINAIRTLHDAFFGAIAKLAGEWFLSLAARFTFLAVLFLYFLNSATTKVGEGVAGFFQPQFGAYIQIFGEKIMTNYDMEIANVPFYMDLIVYMGTYSEFILPVLIVLGLFTRVAAVGMIVFIIVQSYADIYFHGVGAETIGAWFTRESGSAIMDQRTLWVLLLLILVVKGGGAVSLDALLTRMTGKSQTS